MNLQRVKAIASMAQDCPQYNLGVLSMLGRADLALLHMTAAALVDGLIGQREEINSTRDLCELLTPASSAGRALQLEIDEAVRCRQLAWMPIQALIDQAAKVLAEHEGRVHMRRRPRRATEIA